MTILHKRPLWNTSKKILGSKTFFSTMAPIIDICFGPSWFRNRFLGVTPSTAEMSNSVWATFFTLTLLSTWIENGIVGFSFIGYRPNMVARQFDFSQMLPNLLYSWENDIYWSERKFFLTEYRDCMAFSHHQVLELPTFHFQPSFFLTVEFNNWWMSYFQGYFYE